MAKRLALLLKILVVTMNLGGKLSRQTSLCVQMVKL